MAQTVIGFFEDAAAAQKAAQRLESIGIARQDIDVSDRGGVGSNTGASNRSIDRDGRSSNGVTQFFNSLFGNNTDDAERYSKVGNSGYSIVTVHAQSREQAVRAADLLDECGAIDIDEKASQMGYDNPGRDSRSNRANVSSDREQTVPRIQENLEVGKRTIEHGDVRVRSRIVERPVEEQVRLREERIHVERQPVDRPVSPSEMRNFQEGDIELIERAEVPVVNKEARVVEEVRVRKDVTERDETIHETIRHTEVDVDRINRNEMNRDRMGSDFNDPRGV